jgi:hypothetical protein
MNDDDDAERIRALHDLIPSNWDQRPITVAHEIREFLKTICDEGKGIDSGTGENSADLWVWIGGKEFYINIKLTDNS